MEELENTSIDDEYLEKHELTEFLEAVYRHGLPMDLERFYLLAFSGMRSGELCALKWPDLNFNTNQVRITKTLYNEKSNMKLYELVTPKTTGSIRTIDIDICVMKLLKEFQERQNKIMAEAKKLIPDFHDANFVFCRENGYPFVQKNVLIRMERLLKKTSIKKEATPHIFRHTHISMLAEAGIDLKTIMQRVGHDDPKTTLRIYSHVTEKMRKNANERIQIHFTDILNFNFHKYNARARPDLQET